MIASEAIIHHISNAVDASNQRQSLLYIFFFSTSTDTLLSLFKWNSKLINTIHNRKHIICVLNTTRVTDIRSQKALINTNNDINFQNTCLNYLDLGDHD